MRTLIVSEFLTLDGSAGRRARPSTQRMGVRGHGPLEYKDGGPILVAGSRTLVQTLVAHDLVDEYDLRKHELRLVDTRTFRTGVAVHTYHRAPARARDERTKLSPEQELCR